MSLIKLAARGEQIANLISKVGRGFNMVDKATPQGLARKSLHIQLTGIQNKINPKNVVETSRDFKTIKDKVFANTMKNAKNPTHAFESMKNSEKTLHGWKQGERGNF